MPYSYVLLPGNGSTTNFGFSFGYLSRNHIGVKVDGVVTSFTFLTDFTLEITPAPAGDTIVEVRRTTPLNEAIVDWSDGSTLTEADMDLNTRFSLYAAQEAADGVAASITQNSLGVWDGQGRSTTNFADPEDDTSLVTKGYFSNVYTPQLDAKVAEATSQASASAVSASASQGYAAASDASADSAAALLGLFRGQYLGAKATPPTLDGNGQPVTTGDLYFDTVDLAMKVYTGSAWQNAGSTVAGTIGKPDTPVIATAGQTVVPVPDGYDPGFIIVFVNGAKIDAPDINITSGSNIVFTVGLGAGDEVTWVAFGAFDVANAIPADNSVTTPRILDGAVTDAKIDTVSASKVLYQQTGTGTILRDLNGILHQGVSIFDFIPLNLHQSILDGTITTATDLKPYLAAAKAWVAAKTYKPSLLFPPGLFPYSESPNWAMQHFSILALGDTRLRYTGTGDAFIVDGTGAPNMGVFHFTAAGFTIDAPTSAGNGAFINRAHKSRINLNVMGAGAAHAGIRTEFCVSSHFDNCAVSPNSEGGWFNGAMPLYGFHVTGGPTTQSSYCLFTNAAGEGCNATNGAALFLECALGNKFDAGTFEGSKIGILTASSTSGCVSNKFYDVDMEVNSVCDIYEQGFNNEYHGCDTNSLFNVIGTATRTNVFGGQHHNISIAAGANSPGFFGCIWNRNGSGTFSIGDNSVRLRDCFDHFNNVPGPFPQTSVAVGATPWVYDNTSGRDVELAVSSGTITQVQVIRGGVATLVNPSAGLYRLSPRDKLQISHTSPPVAWAFYR